MRGGGLIQTLRSLRLIVGGETVVVRALPDPATPRAYWGPYPIRAHRTMAQVMADEARA